MATHPAPSTPPVEVTLALRLLFSLQGIPCLYYGTEQGLSGTVKPDGTPDLRAPESVREALWRKTPVAFDETHPVYKAVQALTTLRSNEPALSYGRLYFREVSGDGSDFGQSSGNGGVVAFSRILVDRELLVVANTNASSRFSGSVIVDLDINATPRRMQVAFIMWEPAAEGPCKRLRRPGFSRRMELQRGAAALPVVLASDEVQILTPE